jgi:3-oxoacyl-[acyl-carrier-protein] synthase-3
MTKLHAAITAIHGYVPDYILTNEELEKMIDTTDEWITSRTGIKERHILREEGKATSDMAAQAVLGLLEKSGTNAEDIDLLICATVTPDMVFPATANLICDKVGAKNAWGYDLAAACSGFLFGLQTGASFIETGKYKKVIVVGADKMSSIVDYTDRATCIIFGDGAGAVLLEASNETEGVLDAVLGSDGSGKTYLNLKAGGSLKPASAETIAAKEHFLYQEGQAVFKFAVTKMADAAEDVMKRNNLTGDDIAFLVPHQANKRIIDATARRCGIAEDIQKYGNTTAATIPLCLWDWEKKLKKGDNLILAAFGGGFTWGAIYLKWAYNS